MIRTLNMAMCKPLCGLRGPRECLTSAFGGHAPSGAACLMAASLHLSHPPTPCVHHYGHDVSIPPGRIAAPSLGGQAPMSLSFYFKKNWTLFDTPPRGRLLWKYHLSSVNNATKRKPIWLTPKQKKIRRKCP